MGKGNGKGRKNCGFTVTASGPAVAAELDDLLPQRWNSEELNIEYVDTPEAMQACVEALRHPEVIRVGLDIETTGGLKPWYGTTRLIQVGVELPEPKQFLVDCWAIDPAPIFPILEDPRIEVVTHNGEYEQKHLHFRYGIILTNQWDTCYASRLIWKQKGEPLKDSQKKAVARAESPFRKELRELRKQQKEMEHGSEEYEKMERKIAKVAKQMKAAREETRASTPSPRTAKHTFKALMRRYLGKQISKEQQTSAWDDPELSRAQCRYAAMDVAGLLDVRRAIGREVQEKELGKDVARANRDILDRSLEELASGSRSEDEFFRLARAMSNARDQEELDGFYALQGQASIHYTYRQKLEQLYKRKSAELG